MNHGLLSRMGRELLNVRISALQACHPSLVGQAVKLRTPLHVLSQV
jgi:hypothetical protein